MTQQEFMTVYAELADHFGQNAFSAKRGKLLFDQIQKLDAPWFRRIAHKMILANDSRFDIWAAAKQEIGSRDHQQRTDDEVGAYRNFNRALSEKGYNSTLQKLGAKSLWEAIEIKRRKV